MSVPELDTLVAQLQRRIARLLLRHDRRTFRGRFRELYARSMLPQPELLRTYDRYTRLIILADELFNDLLPRIRRQMSFHATRLHMDEEAPLRGQIDWNRSLQRAWNDHPDQPPIRFQTTLRSRSFATPENQLVVAVLQRYMQLLNQLRTDQSMADAPLNIAEDQELAQLVDRVRRELATAHFQELSHEIDPAQVSDLAGQVGRRVRGGANPYADMLGWWNRLEHLHLRVKAPQSLAPTLNTQEQSGLLYQLWIALELVDFLVERKQLGAHEIRSDHLILLFSWQGRDFRLVYDRQPKAHLAWFNGPGERPDYFITRANAMHVAAPDGTTIWQEPGVLLDAKCYLGEHASRASEPIKRMLADIQLVDATNGILIMPNIAGLKPDIYPQPDRYLGNITPTAGIHLTEMRPMEDRETLHAALEHILDQATAWLPERAAVECHGTWADRDTVRPSITAQPVKSSASLVFCPKPHIGRHRIDLVSPEHDCLRNPQVCHILSRPGAKELVPPYVQRVQTREELLGAITHLRSQLNQRFTANDTSAEAETARSQLINAMGGLVDEYRTLMQPDTRQIEQTLKVLFKRFWDESLSSRGLPDDVRNMLISGEFVWSQFEGTSIEDWAACAVQYVRAIEREFQRRLYDRCGQDHWLRHYGKPMGVNNFTFGTISYAYRNRNARVSRSIDPNWQIFLIHAVAASGAAESDFEGVIGELSSLADLRNKIAHSHSISLTQASTIRATALFDERTSDPGALVHFVEMLDA